MIDKSFKGFSDGLLLKIEYFLRLGIPLMVCLTATASYGQLTNDDRFLQRTPPSTEPIDTTPTENPPSIENNPPEVLGQENKIEVETIVVTGSTIFTEADFQPIIAPLFDRTVTETELQTAADTITQLYLDRGFLTSRAIIDVNSLNTGKINILVIEGKLEDIEIEGTERLTDYIRDRIELGASVPLNTKALEDQLRLLKNDPLVGNIEANLRAGSGVGLSKLKVTVIDAKPLTGGISVDNYSVPSIGSEKLNLNLAYRNLTGLEDTFSIAYSPRLNNFTDTFKLDLRYSVPLNPMNGTLELRTVLDRNEIIQPPFDVFDIRGETEVYELSYRQPLIRTPTEEFALSFGFTYQSGQTFVFSSPTPFGIGPDANGVSSTSVFKFGQEYISREELGAWALRSQFNLGTGLFDATDNNNPIPDGHFFSWLGQIQRVQVLDNNNFLILSLEAQFSPDALLPSEQFVIGGGQSVRGYRQNVLAGDNGIRFSIENRFTLARNEEGESVFQIAPFLDGGYVWNNNDNPNQILSDDTFIIALGLGILWQPIEGFNIRLDYAPPLIDLDNRGDDIQDDGLYFNVGYSF
jgi:hemolysin activation/secretion protein